jgi:spore germination cell wall hydrolase CwlJ-like protein
VKRIGQAVGALLIYLWLAVFVAMMVVVHTPKAEGKERFGMVHLRKGDVDVLARTLFGEARGEGRKGMEAVAWVILNRVRRGAPRFHNTVTEVCKAKYQFTCWAASDPNAKICAAVDESDPSFLLALNVSTAVLGGMVPDPTKGADHYFVTKMANPPEWRKKMELQATIGAHSFYKE